MSIDLSPMKTAARQLMWSATSIDRIAENATPEQLGFLAQAMDCELACRDESRRDRYQRQAGFPMIKGFTGYEWGNVSLPPALTRADIETCQFVKAGHNLVLLGPVGTGKTHLAIAVGLAACQLGISTRYFTVADLVVKLAAASAAGTLDKTMARINKAELVILDELGYVPIDRDAARLLFQVIADAYEARSLIITTNVAFSHWGAVLTDDQMAAAMIDRIAHHGHLVTFTGSSWRMTHALMAPQKGTRP